MTFEREGVPAVGVMTSAFVDGAELMGEACGAPGYPFAVIEHPISSATAAELLGRAAEIMRQAEGLLLAAGPRDTP